MPAPHKTRPAETTGGIGATATIIVAALGASKTAIAVIGAVAGALPAAVTFLVAHGGIAGLWRSLIHGRS